jgi:LmbE family N-acetylglucosaminyl deacetylase
MTVVVFSPHNDDAELFCAYQVLREGAHVVVCFRSQVQEQRGAGINYTTRERETQEALNALGCPSWEQWAEPDTDPDVDRLLMDMIHLDIRLTPTKVFAPCVEEGGHSQHNLVGDCAEGVFGARLVSYMTYVRGQTRSRGGTEVQPDAEERQLKRQALDCHRSQIKLANTRYWFSDESEWWREWLR